MRTTVEITDGQHHALTAVAHRRGLRGFSQLVQEALDNYLRNLATDEVELLLGLEGMLGDDEEREMRSRVDEVRSRWRAS